MTKKDIIGQLPRLNKNTKIGLTINCKEIFKDEKNSRTFSLVFAVENGYLKIKIGSKYHEIGRLEQITFEEFCHFESTNPNFVYSQYKDLYKITLDKDLVDKYYYEKRCPTTEDLSLAYGYLHYAEAKYFFNLCLLDYEEIPENVRKIYSDGKDYDYICIENRFCFPEWDYKIEFL